MANVTTTQIANFVRTLRNDGSFLKIHARLPDSHPLIRVQDATQIHSFKHNLRAYAFDEVGNLTALHEDGMVRQHIGEDEINKAMGLA